MNVYDFPLPGDSKLATASSLTQAQSSLLKELQDTKLIYMEYGYPFIETPRKDRREKSQK